MNRQVGPSDERQQVIDYVTWCAERERPAYVYRKRFGNDKTTAARYKKMLMDEVARLHLPVEVIEIAVS